MKDCEDKRATVDTLTYEMGDDVKKASDTRVVARRQPHSKINFLLENTHNHDHRTKNKSMIPLSLLHVMH
jgi:hypothetical protein